ncbi:Uncharacterised protein [Legionella pneumophila]|nr:Uncharacterised protein [Legionella pneumophila]CZO19809.1 Uncharacterised protein [Legionella pneumophila]CZP64749.1 Uncharacterised protein [Legionella pneumophila]
MSITDLADILNGLFFMEQVANRVFCDDVNLFNQSKNGQFN